MLAFDPAVANGPAGPGPGAEFAEWLHDADDSEADATLRLASGESKCMPISVAEAARRPVSGSQGHRDRHDGGCPPAGPGGPGCSSQSVVLAEPLYAS
jgi:hypothetical protein